MRGEREREMDFENYVKSWSVLNMEKSCVIEDEYWNDGFVFGWSFLDFFEGFKLV